MGSDANKNAISFREIVSLTLSIAAFILSLVNFYFINFRVEDDLRARVIGASAKEDTAIVRVAFVNSGNRQATILAPFFQYIDTSFGKSGEWGAELENENDFPIILQPHEMKLADLKVSSEQLTVNNEADSTAIQYYLAIEFSSLDSKAISHDVWGYFNVGVLTTTNNIVRIHERKNLNSYPFTNLYDGKIDTASSILKY
jgi:hypothetical protein